MRVVRLASAEQAPVLTYCIDAEYLVPESALNSFSPISADVARVLGFKHKRFTIAEMSRYTSTLIEAPKHGTVRLLDAASHNWLIEPDRDYEGPDRAVFTVEGNGRQVRVVWNFLVMPIMVEQQLKCREFRFGNGDRSVDRSTLLAVKVE